MARLIAQITDRQRSGAYLLLGRYEINIFKNGNFSGTGHTRIGGLYKNFSKRRDDLNDAIKDALTFLKHSPNENRKFTIRIFNADGYIVYETMKSFASFKGLPQNIIDKAHKGD